jgi:glutamine amidotransferase
MKAKKIAILESGGANFSSIYHALVRLGAEPSLTKDVKELEKSDALILPGVGSAGFAMKQLQDSEFVDYLKSLEKPVLGICLGKQLLCLSSEEDDAEGLGIIPIKVRRLQGPKVIPHMGWNNLVTMSSSEPLLRGITTDDNFYFIHSYGAEVHPSYTKGICDYEGRFSAVIRRDNFCGVQFHPEKSGVSGLKLLNNFLELKL